MSVLAPVPHSPRALDADYDSQSPTPSPTHFDAIGAAAMPYAQLHCRGHVSAPKTLAALPTPRATPAASDVDAPLTAYERLRLGGGVAFLGLSAAILTNLGLPNTNFTMDNFILAQPTPADIASMGGNLSFCFPNLALIGHGICVGFGWTDYSDEKAVFLAAASRWWTLQACDLRAQRYVAPS